MFKVSRDRVFKRKVSVRIPSADSPDQVTEGEFIATFRALARSDYERMAAEKLTDRQFLEKILVGVEGIGGDDGVAYPPADALALVVEDIELSAAAVQVFVGNYTKERAGN